MKITISDGEWRRHRRLMVAGIIVSGVLGVAMLAWAALGAFDEGVGLFAYPFVLWWQPIEQSMARFVPVDQMAQGAVVWLVCIVAMQAAFLRLGRNWRPRLMNRGRPMRSSLVAAGFVCALLTIGTGQIAFEVLWRDDIFRNESAFPAVSFAWVALLATWLAWSLVFALTWRRGRRYSNLVRFLRRLWVGTILETVAATVVFAWNPWNRDCYCERPSYGALMLGGTVIFWLFGPSVLLLVLGERMRQRRLKPICAQCGYDLRGTAAHTRRCPECGTKVDGWARLAARRLAASA